MKVKLKDLQLFNIAAIICVIFVQHLWFNLYFIYHLDLQFMIKFFVISLFQHGAYMDQWISEQAVLTVNCSSYINGEKRVKWSV